MVAHAPGTPPRVWGKRFLGFVVVSSYRYTPTRVGKTVDGVLYARDMLVHPHACGENVPQFTGVPVGQGTPPRVWGKRPACTIENRYIDGTPPRVWGKPTPPKPLPGAGRYTPTRVGKTGGVQSRSNERYRYTPTRVGKTLEHSFDFCQNMVHPHACGENVWSILPAHGFKGTPPRVWGKPDDFSPLRYWTPVHPHACGENVPPDVLTPFPEGTPPRVWGKLRMAYWATTDRQVHPHACGEN